MDTARDPHLKDVPKLTWIIVLLTLALVAVGFAQLVTQIYGTKLGETSFVIAAIIVLAVMLSMILILSLIR